MPFYQSGPVRLYYEIHGEGEPVIFLHGSTLDRRMWFPQIPALSPNFRMILPDSRGHGLSDCPTTGYHRSFRVEDVRSLADNLNLETFHLVGLSMGGSTALGFGLKHQERLRSLILVSTSAGGYSFGTKFTRYFDLAASKGIEETRRQWLNMSLKWFGEEQRDIQQLMATMIKEHSFAGWLDSSMRKYPPANDLEHVHAIQTPTRIIVGQKDKMFVPVAEALHERMPNCSLSIYEDTGHMVNLEQPEKFNAELCDWLEPGYKT